MRLPMLEPAPRTRLVTESFLGYDHRPAIADGALFDTENLSAREFPLLCTRPRRGLVTTLSAPGGLLGKGALCHVEGGTLYVNQLPTALTGLSAGAKQLVSMGAAILVFPDKKYYNTEAPTDFGSLEADVTLTGDVRYTLCGLDGEDWDDPDVGESVPENPANGALWLSNGTLCQYSEALGVWNELETVCRKLSFSTRGVLPGLFRQYDGVELSGAAEGFTGSRVLYAVGGGENEDDYLVLVGEPGAAFTQESASVRIRRRVPDFDYVCECQNRLWGCRYGHDGSGVVNEIYASALGDFKNFRQYLGLSTDSWTASVGSDGAWTGAVNFLGHPCFFKENRIHTVTVSPTGAHRLEETVCPGVQRGCAGSLTVVDERLYYKSPGGVCVWQGGFPQPFGAELGDMRYDAAVGGALDGVWYLSMREAARSAGGLAPSVGSADAGESPWQLFTFDTRRGVWYREDALHVLSFAEAGGELYALAADGKLWALRGTAGTLETALSWRAETGPERGVSPDRQVLSRLSLYLRLAEGARVAVFIEYDAGGEWDYAGTVEGKCAGSVSFPLRPRRCEQLRLRLVGTGEAKLLSLTRVREVSGDA